MVSFSRLMKEPLFLTDRSRRLCMASSSEKLKSNLKKRRYREWNISPTLQYHSEWSLFSSSVTTLRFCCTVKWGIIYLSLNSGLRSRFLTLVFLLVLLFLSGWRLKDTYESEPSLEHEGNFLHKNKHNKKHHFSYQGHLPEKPWAALHNIVIIFWLNWGKACAVSEIFMM